MSACAEGLGTESRRWPVAEQLGAPLPASTDVLIIGGGLAGAALAYYLAREGVEVVLVERGELNREASGTNAGSFHFQIAIHQLTAFDTGAVRERLLAEVRLLAEAAAIWETLEQELDGQLDVHVTGGLMVAETEAQLQLLHDKHAIERDAGLETHVLAGAELRRFAPFLADDLTGATWCPREGHANPLLAAPLFAERAIDHGAVLRTHSPVTAVEHRDGPAAQRFRVTTAAGSIDAHRIVNASGAWANEVAALSGLSFPLWADGLHVNVTEPRARLLEPMVQHIGRRLTLKQSANNTFIIGGGWPGAARATAAALLDQMGERRRQRGGRGTRGACTRRCPCRAHLVRRDRVHRRSRTDRRRNCAASRVPPLRREHGLYAEPTHGTHARRGDDFLRARQAARRILARPTAPRPRVTTERTRMIR